MRTEPTCELALLPGSHPPRSHPLRDRRLTEIFLRPVLLVLVHEILLEQRLRDGELGLDPVGLDRLLLPPLGLLPELRWRLRRSLVELLAPRLGEVLARDRFGGEEEGVQLVEGEAGDLLVGRGRPVPVLSLVERHPNLLLWLTTRSSAGRGRHRGWEGEGGNGWGNGWGEGS